MLIFDFDKKYLIMQNFLFILETSNMLKIHAILEKLSTLNSIQYTMNILHKALVNTCYLLLNHY